MKGLNNITLPKVSVIIPVYNVEKYIEKCARSLFQQSLDEIEYIFVDDSSPDNSVSIVSSVLEEFPHRKNQVQIIHHDYNKGLTAARNTGVSIARGEFIAHCDSDDWVDIHMYEKMYCEAKRTNSDIILCDIYMVEKHQTYIFQTAKIGCDNVETLNNYILLPWTCTVNMLTHHDIYRIHSITSPNGIAYCEDYHLTVRLLYYAKKITKLSKPFYFYNRLNESSITHNLNDKQRRDRYWCDMDIISFFTSNNVLHQYERSISLRILNYTKYWILDKKNWGKFQSYYPASHRYIKDIKDIRYWHKLLLINIACKNMLMSNILYQIWQLRLKFSKLIRAFSS